MRNPLSRLLLALTMVSASIVAPASPAGAVGPIEDLGTPVTDYSILDVALGADSSGNPRLYGSTYAIGASPGVVFFGVDPVTGTVSTQHTMTGSYGGYHTAVATDGKAYLGTISSTQMGRLWRYTPATDSISVVAYQQEPAYSFFFGNAPSAAAGVFLGGYPSGRLNEFTSAGNLVDHGVVSAGSSYPKGIAQFSTSPRSVFVGGGTPAKATVVNLDTGVRTEVLPPAYAGYSFAYNAYVAGGYVLVQLVTPGTKVLRFSISGGALSFVDELTELNAAWTVPVPGAPNEVYAAGNCGTGAGVVRYHLVTKACTFQFSANWVGARVHPVTIGGVTWLTGISTKGLFGRWNSSTGAIVTNQLTLPGQPTNITALAQGPDGKVYGGTYETNKLFRYDGPGTSVLGDMPAGGGEILSMTSAGGKLFIGVYPGAAMCVYDPTLGWSPGSTATSNPRAVGTIGTQQGRPWDMTAGTDGRVWTATGAEYGQLYGALTAIGASSPYTMESWRGLDGDHNIFSVASGGGKVFFGSTKHGDGVSATGYEQFLVFDVATETLTFSAAIDFTSNYIYSLVYASNGILYGSTDSGQLFRFNPATTTILSSVAFPYGPILGMINGPGGRIYGHTSSTIFEIVPSTNTVTALATTPSSYYRTLAFDSAGYLYWADGSRLKRMLV